MAMTSVADTRFLLTFQFSPDEAPREKVRVLLQKELASGMVLPAIVLSEFVKVAGAKIGVQAAVRTIELLKERGMKVKPVDEEVTLEAGKMLLKHTNVPFADALVAAFTFCKIAQYVLSDDPHFQVLGCRTKWF
jgi:predicted nucleic acid-binding protein